MQARARFMNKARALGHNTGDSAYIRVFVNFLLARDRDSRKQPTESEWNGAYRDLCYWAIGADEWKGLILGSTSPRKLWMEGFKKRWNEGHPDSPLPPDVFEWMKICRSSRFDAEIETKGSSG